MDNPVGRELTGQGRAALTTMLLFTNQVVTTQMIIDKTGLTRKGVYYMLDNVACAVPLVELDKDQWSLLSRFSD